jgi:hypothetical protein
MPVLKILRTAGSQYADSQIFENSQIPFAIPHKPGITY